MIINGNTFLTSRKEFHDALIDLRNKINNGRCLINRHDGICNNVAGVYDSCLLVKKYAKGWKFHSGNNTFPVEGNYTDYAINDPWKGPFAESRKHLLNYLIRNTR